MMHPTPPGAHRRLFVYTPSICSIIYGSFVPVDNFGDLKLSCSCIILSQADYEKRYGIFEIDYIAGWCAICLFCSISQMALVQCVRDVSHVESRKEYQYNIKFPRPDDI